MTVAVHNDKNTTMTLMPALTQALTLALSNFNRYVMTRDSRSAALASCIQHIGQAQTLLTPLHGASLLVQEMYAVASALRQTTEEHLSSAHAKHALLQALRRLPVYLKLLSPAQPDHVLSLLTDINALRLSRHAPLLTEEALFQPNLSIALPDKIAPRPIKAALSLPRQLDHNFRLTLHQWLQHNDNTNLRKLRGLIHYLRLASQQQMTSLLWWVSDLLLEALEQGGLHINEEIVSVLTRLTALIQQQKEYGEQALIKQAPSALLSQLFLLAAKADKPSDGLTLLKTTYGLHFFDVKRQLDAALTRPQVLKPLAAVPSVAAPITSVAAYLLKQRQRALANTRVGRYIQRKVSPNNVSAQPQQAKETGVARYIRLQSTNTTTDLASHQDNVRSLPQLIDLPQVHRFAAIDNSQFDSLTIASTDLDALLANSDQLRRSIHSNHTLSRAQPSTATTLALDHALSQQAKLATHLQQALMQTALLPFQAIQSRLEQQVKRSAQHAGKEIHLLIQHADCHLDSRILERLAMPLEDLLHHSITHSPSVDKLNLTLQENEAGLQISLHNNSHGFTTPQSLTALAEIDAVTQQIQALHGRFTVLSSATNGTRFIIQLPPPLTIQAVLHIQAQDRSYLIAQQAIQAVTYISAAQYQTLVTQETATYHYHAKDYRLVSLAQLLDSSAMSPSNAQRFPLLLFERQQQRFALQVDSILERAQLAVHPLGAQLASIPSINGVANLDNGNPVFRLNITALLFSDNPNE